ncbi:MAG: DSBA oxidoreductase [Fusobacteria bacterium]|nr:MAG: DSBA oxidoreductase [Fusobacteriota bacterium]KAF0228596.1 MAG: hypothetical protein FD182_852 [Fusobacteriota bacterium]
MAKDKIIEIIEFTDPVCTWCWGSEPILRKLETRYGDQIIIKYIMGGLVKDIREFYDSFNDIGRDPELSNKQIAKHWLEASQRHGMPVRTEGFRMFSNQDLSTYPQNIAYKAAQMENQQLADKFLRRVREASASEAKQTNKQDILVELASEVGLDISKFIGRLNDGSAEAAFKEDLYITQQYGVRGFPSFLIRYGEREVMTRSFQSFESFKSIIDSLAGGEIREYIPDKSSKSVLDFIKKYGRVAPVEIQVSLDMSENDVALIINKLVSENQCRIIVAGNGSFIELIHNPLDCDPMSGFCKV